MGRPFGFISPVPDTALGREYGVYVWWRTQDFDMQVGAELRAAVPGHQRPTSSSG